MNPFVRYLLFAGESMIYGPAYGFMNQLIRVPEPLEPNRAWDLVTGEWGPLATWFRKSYPPRFARRILLDRLLRPDHSDGIEDH